MSKTTGGKLHYVVTGERLLCGKRVRRIGPFVTPRYTEVPEEVTCEQCKARIPTVRLIVDNG